MGLDIQFLDDDPAAAELDGSRLTSMPGFFNLVRVLGGVLPHLNRPDDEMDFGIYQGVERYAQDHPEARERFREYLGFATEFREQVPEDARAQLDFPDDPEEYDPIASTFAAALMLRDSPIDGEEAGRIVHLIAFIKGFGKILLAIPHPGLGPEQVGWALQVLERYNQCLEVASEKGLRFQISF
ncbi:MAG TPA: hypothetical protein VI383_05075 [Gemmatimonadales bacterium]|nr:hypothetical protein [Gemmatimonadales bacterium]